MSTVSKPEGPHTPPAAAHHQSFWLWVMCLTGVDYFSTLAYQPSIAFENAGLLAPFATVVLVLVTVFGALPLYRYVAGRSFNGQGSIGMLAKLVAGWPGKVLVLTLLGFAATDFVITKTLSAADAAEHLIANPLWPMEHPDAASEERQRLLVTMGLLVLLGAVFLRGFREVIGLAVFLVATYLLLNAIVIGAGLAYLAGHPDHFRVWLERLGSGQWYAEHRPVSGTGLGSIALFCLIIFPRLALGLSGFETGVAVMPLVKGEPGDDSKSPAGRIRNTRRLLLTAALIMSVMLIASSVVTTLLIPAHEFAEATSTTPKGAANGRALAFLAHQYLGNAFGTAYDLSTILILWFAGASAMAGLLNIVPRYLPRYGMAPDWTRATRPLVLVLTAIAFAVTIIFDADVNAQGGAYATGVLVLMSSAAVAVTLSAWREGAIRHAFLLIALVFAYTTILNIYERPEGIKIASLFIGAIILVSFVSRAMRSTELRVEKVVLNDAAREFLEEARQGTIRIIANRPDRGDADEYRLKEKQERWNNHIPAQDPVLFFEVRPGDVSDFSGVLRVRGVQVGSYKVLRTRSPAVPNAIAAFLLHLRDSTGQIPHVYFGWTDVNPLWYVLKFIFFGEGDTAPVTHEILRQAEHDPSRRPAVHVGG